MTKSPRRWLDGWDAYRHKHTRDLKITTGNLNATLQEDYLRLIVKTEIAADRKARMRDKSCPKPNRPGPDFTSDTDRRNV